MIAHVLPIMEHVTEYDETSGALRIHALKAKINDEAYLCEAIQRIALVLSNEIIEGTKKRTEQREST